MYSLVLQKSWGSPTNNLVKVTVETNVVPGNSQPEGIAVPMESDGPTIVDFVLESGRRTESVSEAELAVANHQMSAAQQVVARNTALWRWADEGVLAQQQSTTTSQTNNQATNQTNNQGGGLGPDIRDYLYGSRYVGYQPEVTALSVGSMLYFDPYSVAVSPDRRYVLMRVNQQYSTLRSVGEFGTGIGGGSGGSVGGTGGMNMGGMGGMGGGGFGGGMGGGGYGGGGYGGGGGGYGGGGGGYGGRY